MTLAIIWIFGLALAWAGLPIGDEWVHYRQIVQFREGDFRILEQWLTTLPGYHWAVTLALIPFDADSLAAARTVNAGFGVIALALFHAVRRTIEPTEAVRSTAQFAVLPILFPLVFLVYTDVLSLALVLAAFFATLRRRHLVSSLLLVMAVGVRQNNVLWAGFLAAWALWPIWLAHGSRLWRAWRASLTIAWPYAIPVLVFAIYWAWNGTVSYSGSQSSVHPDGVLRVGNVFFCLFLIAFLMPLQTIAGLAEFVGRALRRPAWWLFPPIVFGLFAWLFVVDHPYNHLALGVNVRNHWLMLVQEQTWAWLVFGFAAAGAACALTTEPQFRSQGWLLAPSAALFLAASWLVEPRYSLIPLVLYLTLRRSQADWIEVSTLALWAVLAVYLAAGIFGFRLII